MLPAMRAHLGWIGAIAFLLALSTANVASAQVPGLELVAPDSIAVSVSDGTSDEVSVWLRNTTSKVVVPAFKASLEKSDGQPVNATVKLVGGPAQDLAAKDVGRYRVYLTNGEESSGLLVATSPPVAPATVLLSLAPKPVADRGVNAVLLISLIAAIVLIAAAWFFVVRPVSLTNPLGTLELKFTESFASSLTAAGALLGVVISAGVLPDETVVLSKAGFTSLNLIFGVAIVVAGLAYSAGQKPVWQDVTGNPTKQESKFQGFVWPFLLAALITVWAVLGELWTLWLLVDELSQDKGFSGLAALAIKVLIGGAAVGMAPYTLWRIKGIVNSKRDKPNVAAAFGPPAPEPMRNVSLL
jgi:hypothetical protein